MSNNPYNEQCYKVYQFRPGEKPIPSVEPRLVSRLPAYMDSKEQAIQHCRQFGEENLKNGYERISIFGPNHDWVADYYMSDKGLIELSCDANGRFSEMAVGKLLDEQSSRLYKVCAFEINVETMQPDASKNVLMLETKSFDEAVSWCRNHVHNVLDEYCCAGIYNNSNTLLAGYTKDELGNDVEQLFVNYNKNVPDNDVQIHQDFSTREDNSPSQDDMSR